MAILAMRQEPIGLDIGKSSIVGVQLGGKSPMLSLAAVHERRLPEGIVFEGEVLDPDGLAAELKSFVKEGRFKGKLVRLGVGNQKVIVRTIEVPEMDEEELRGAIEAQVAAAGLSPSVTFLGYRTDVPRILPVLDAFVLSSKQEGFGGVCAEAMFSGVPVVSTDAGGMIETVKPGITGLMVPKQNPSALAAAMIRLIQDPELASELADRATGYVNEHLTTDRMVERYVALYEEMIEGKD